jgi:hypothetical protein
MALAEKIAAIRERRTRCKDMLAQLDQTGEDHISLTDPDSRAMAAHTHIATSLTSWNCGLMPPLSVIRAGQETTSGLRVHRNAMRPACPTGTAYSLPRSSRPMHT